MIYLGLGIPRLRGNTAQGENEPFNTSQEHGPHRQDISTWEGRRQFVSTGVKHVDRLLHLVVFIVSGGA